jgi:hypothetical protein
MPIGGAQGLAAWLLDSNLSSNSGKRSRDELEDSQIEIDATGRFGGDSPDVTQTLNNYKADLQYRADWRGQSPEECIPRTWLVISDDEAGKDVKRGEIGIGCASLELAGSRSHSFPFRSINTQVNCLKANHRWLYGGIVGNPGTARGLKNGPRSGSTDGTMNLAGGALTTFMNSPISGYSGQQLFMLTEPLVALDDKGNVIGNRFRYLGYKKVNGHQIKLLPTVLPMSIARIEHLQYGTLMHHIMKMEDMLNYQTINVDKIRGFKNSIYNDLHDCKFTMIQEIEDWVMLFILREALMIAWFGFTSIMEKNTSSVRSAYQVAVETWYVELAESVQQFYRRQQRMAGNRTLSKDSPSSIAEGYDERFPVLLTQGKYKKTDLTGLAGFHVAVNSTSDKLQYHPAAKQVLFILRSAGMAIPTAQNQLTEFISDRWVGSITSPIANAGFVVKVVSRS